jgi:DNA-binding Lrp family transcriptional regulator
MVLEMRKLRKVILQDGRDVTTEITRKQREILETLNIKPEHVQTFLKSWESTGIKRRKFYLPIEI